MGVCESFPGRSPKQINLKCEIGKNNKTNIFPFLRSDNGLDLPHGRIVRRFIVRIDLFEDFPQFTWL